jgi:hypothetical protein
MNFTKNGNTYETTFSASTPFNIHIERDGGRVLSVMKLLLSLLFLTSCINTATTDEYEGSWRCDLLPFGSVESEMVMGFSDGMVEVFMDEERVAHDEYHMVNGIAVMGWNAEIEGIEVLFLDATVSGNNLMLRWKPSDFYYPYTTCFRKE